ncbi:DUF4136 domain-containing protein [Oceanimonas sp. CHS3-5]|uniref:DUF4136 domain-containing protein n=1 Tax=Oceanimonas sp. CHS3-5 TaxID=3068186 RepID=UPI0027401922|nr:DUF4136 domain-containing protein [Oceanimonas sp. CHS3-5]MDP5293762.1 DUF4136 domain-containing protein [Oceanimonas sp. CHS3-5]
MLRILALVLLLSGCTAPYDYAEDTDFRRFDTVALAPEMDTSSLDGARIADAVRTLLPTRGLTLTGPKQASLWLNYRLDENVRLLTTMPSMFGRSGFWDEERVYGARREQHLVLWLEQPGSGRVLWKSRHPNAFPGERVRGAARSNKISQQVEELLENYPPKP